MPNTYSLTFKPLLSRVSMRTVTTRFGLTISVLPSVCLPVSVQCWYCIEMIILTVRIFMPSAKAIVVFEPEWLCNISRVTSSAKALHYTEVGKVCVFRPKSRYIFETVRYMITCGTDRKS